MYRVILTPEIRDFQHLEKTPSGGSGGGGNKDRVTENKVSPFSFLAWAGVLLTVGPVDDNHHVSSTKHVSFSISVSVSQFCIFSAPFSLMKPYSLRLVFPFRRDVLSLVGAYKLIPFGGATRLCRVFPIRRDDRAAKWLGALTAPWLNSAV